MSISLTDSAATHVKSYLEKRGKGVGVRLGVKTTPVSIRGTLLSCSVNA